MSLPKAKFRELVFQILFSCHFMDHVDDQDPSFYMSQLKTTRKNVLEAFEQVNQILLKKESIDAQIRELSTSYELERIQSVELNILRLCIYEMNLKDAPAKEILISEGIRLSKKFSTTASISFINGVLDQLYKNNRELAYNP